MGGREALMKCQKCKTTMKLIGIVYNSHLNLPSCLEMILKWPLATVLSKLHPVWQSEVLLGLSVTNFFVV